MTTARHIVILLKSHIAGDEDRFLATAMQLAAHEASSSRIAEGRTGRAPERPLGQRSTIQRRDNLVG